jgi:CubicO group peptidase (beta-lactamase class C family)
MPQRTIPSARPTQFSRRRLLGAGAALALFPGCASTRPPTASVSRFEPVAALARDAVAKALAPGVAFSVADANGLIFEYAHGFADVEAATPLRPDHLFRVYSQTKAVTCVAAMILADEGRLRLDDPVSAFIPAFARTPVYVSGDTLQNLRTEAQARPVSVRDLMRHTAGLIYRHDTHHPLSALYVARGIDSGSGERFAPTDGGAPFATLESMCNALAEIPLVAQPGSRFTYGNASDVLGRVVEVASGQRLRDFITARICAPLGMNDCMFEVGPDKQSQLTAAYVGLAQPRERNSVLDLVDPTTLGRGALRVIDTPAASVFKQRPIDFGGAGMVCTAGDYLRFARMLAQGGTLDGERILSRASVSEVRRNQLPAPAMDNAVLRELGLGFGLGVAGYVDAAKVPAPVPADVGFWGGAASTFFWFNPERRLGGVIMSQVFGGDFRAYHLPMIRAFYAALDGA